MVELMLPTCSEVFANDLDQWLHCAYFMIVVLGLAAVLLSNFCICMQAQCSVRDCKVGPGFKLSEGSEYRDEVLSKAKVPQ